MSIRGITISALLVLSISGVYSCTHEGKAPAPTLVEAMEAEYIGIYDSPVRLTGGSYEGKPFAEDSAARPTLRLLGDLCVQGDLDADGSEESAVLLVENSGGSGSFLYVAVLERRGDAIRNIGTAPLGDRVQVLTLMIDSGRIVMDVIQHASEDPMCCPTEKAMRNWFLEEGSLVENQPVMMGTVSIDDLGGIEWVLESLGPDAPYGGEPPVTILYDNGRVTGSAGCNGYFSDITEIAPGVIRLGMIGSTRMACGDEMMKMEQRYLEAVSGAAGYSFLAGKLALTCRVEDRIVSLLFKAGVPQ